MYENTLKNCLRVSLSDTNVKNYYVLAADEQYLIDTRKLPIVVILNTEKRNLPGSHWLAFWVYSDGLNNVADYMDSMGNDLLNYNIDFIVPIKFKNNVRIQEYGTLSCGLFCVYYLTLRAKGLSHNRVIERLTHSPVEAEEIVKRFFKNIPCCKSDCSGQGCKASFKNGL